MIRKLSNPIFLKLFLLSKLPMAFIAGLSLEHFSERKTQTSIPYNFITKNPFKSMYFAVQSMAAEFSTAILLAKAIEDSGLNIALIIVRMESEYMKKAKSRIVFTCETSGEIESLMKTVETLEEGGQITLISEGKDKLGNIVSRFAFTWSLRKRN